MSNHTVAFFGATGGCCCAALALALKNGYHCRALARTPEKLSDLLVSKGVTKDTQTTYLHVIQGDVEDISAVKEVLLHDSQMVDMIISGIGTVFGTNKKMDLKICETATRSYLRAISELKPTKPPYMTVISSTGITKGARDLPFLLGPLYHILLAKPHKDKRAMENLVVAALEEKTISAYTIMRLPLLTSGSGSGMQSLRVGTEAKPAIGYSISRNDVGLWLFESLIRGTSSLAEGQYANEAVTLTL